MNFLSQWLMKLLDRLVKLGIYRLEMVRLHLHHRLYIRGWKYTELLVSLPSDMNTSEFQDLFVPLYSLLCSIGSSVLLPG